MILYVYRISLIWLVLLSCHVTSLTIHDHGTLQHDILDQQQQQHQQQQQEQEQQQQQPYPIDTSVIQLESVKQHHKDDTRISMGISKGMVDVPSMLSTDDTMIRRQKSQVQPKKPKHEPAPPPAHHETPP